MESTLYPREQVESLLAWATRMEDILRASMQAASIMREVFPSFDPRSVNMLSRGETLNAELKKRGLLPLPAESVLWIDGPIICHSGGGWGPAWEGHPVRNPTTSAQIRLERLESTLGASPFPVGPTEIGAVMFAATMAAPLSDTSHRIYLWAAAKWLDRTLKMPPGTTLGQLGADLAQELSDEDVLLREPFRSAYRNLAAEIRRKVIDESRRRRSAPTREEARSECALF